MMTWNLVFLRGAKDLWSTIIVHRAVYAVTELFLLSVLCSRAHLAPLLKAMQPFIGNCSKQLFNECTLACKNLTGTALAECNKGCKFFKDGCLFLKNFLNVTQHPPPPGNGGLWPPRPPPPTGARITTARPWIYKLVMFCAFWYFSIDLYNQWLINTWEQSSFT